MTRRHGRSPRGKRGRASVPHGHGKPTTRVGGLRVDGLTAPMVIDGAMTGAAFSAYANARRGPGLGTGDIVGLDHLSAHQVEGGRAAIAKTGATRLSRPPYSPDVNPLEQAFATLKALLRKASARSVDGLESALAWALEALSPEECSHYFSHAGYKAV